MPSLTHRDRDLLWGRVTASQRRRHWLVFVGGYALAVVGLFVVMVLAPRVSAGGAALGAYVYDPVLPAVLFSLPPVVSAASAYRDGGLLASVAVGVTPALTFGTVLGAVWVARFLASGEPPLGGDSPLWVLVLVFAAIGLAGALAGYVVGVVGRVVVRAVRRR